jgi:hypothetical protein
MRRVAGARCPLFRDSKFLFSKEANSVSPVHKTAMQKPKRLPLVSCEQTGRSLFRPAGWPRPTCPSDTFLPHPGHGDSRTMGFLLAEEPNRQSTKQGQKGVGEGGYLWSHLVRSVVPPIGRIVLHMGGLGQTGVLSSP